MSANLPAAARQQAAAVAAELEKHGVADHLIEWGGKHPRIVFVHKGRERFYVLSSTPSDRRTTQNAIADIRRMLGVVRAPKAPKPAKRRKAVAPPVEKKLPKITVKPDPWCCLMAHPARLEGHWECDDWGMKLGAADRIARKLFRPRP